jgi:hypothetical protein
MHFLKANHGDTESTEKHRDKNFKRKLTTETQRAQRHTEKEVLNEKITTEAQRNK